MDNLIESHSKKAGLPPGSLVYVGRQKVEKTTITILDYDETQFLEKDDVNVEECFPFRDKNTTTWIHVKGLHEPEIIETIGSHYNIHHLILEDILNTKQRPKMEEYEDCLFIVLKIFYYTEKETELSVEQLSLVLASNVVLLFQEEGQDIFEPVRKRIKGSRGRIRKMGADYLCYALMDTAIDHYFAVIETMDDRMESIEELIADPSQETLNEIDQLRHEMILLRKALLPIRELITNLKKTDSPLVNDITRVYLRDLSDHTIRIIDTIGVFREMITSSLEIYHSSMSNRMNEVMKVLTIIATIFIPLSFIAGIYGMNFKYMPELEWRWGYIFVWLIIILVALSLLLYFKKKKWL